VNRSTGASACEASSKEDQQEHARNYSKPGFNLVKRAKINMNPNPAAGRLFPVWRRDPQRLPAVTRRSSMVSLLQGGLRDFCGTRLCCHSLEWNDHCAPSPFAHPIPQSHRCASEDLVCVFLEQYNCIGIAIILQL
jgi:hypothetical protein